MIIYSENYLSPLGWINVKVKEEKIFAIEWKNEESENPDYLTSQCIKQIDEYFQGKRKKFNLDLNLKGTPLQVAALKAMLEVPYGETCSYEMIAYKIGHPKAVRFVGTCCHKNPLTLVVPCHRIVKKNGDIGNYANGISCKEQLLLHEKR